MNTHYLFNEKYFEGIGNDTRKMQGHISALNTTLVGMTYKETDQVIPTIGYHCLLFSVLYPGVLLGLGSPHELAKDYGGTDDDIKTGFTMDYVTGLPIIPGTTVKGTLRSVFKKPERKDYKNDAVWDERLSAYGERQEYLKDIMKEIAGTGDVDIADLEQELFVNGRDIFPDAYPVKADEKERLYGIDFITPHKDPISNPNLIRILKVMPGVQYLFRFRLSSSENFSFLTADVKEKLYSRILEDFGIGAKTNVGFGMLQKVSERNDQYCLLRSQSKDLILGSCPRCGSYVVWKNEQPQCTNPDCKCRIGEYFHIPLSREKVTDLLMGRSVWVENVPRYKDAAEYEDRLIRLNGYTTVTKRDKKIYYADYQAVKRRR